MKILYLQLNNVFVYTSLPSEGKRVNELMRQGQLAIYNSERGGDGDEGTSYF